MMRKKIELPLTHPIYSTYHYQGPATAILVNNPSIRNWYMNEILMLTCTCKFLNGFTTPEISIAESAWHKSPFLDKKGYNMQFLKGHTHYVIRNLLDAGYYVCFRGIDDYYVEGKSWYRERHFNHDGCICGYDQESKKYCIYAYDTNWIYQKFWTTQKSFDAGRRANFNNGVYGSICGIKVKEDHVQFSSKTALEKITEYLNSYVEKHPETNVETVYGIDVHDYISRYIEMLYDASIPYEKMDRRVFRLIWEHKKAMLERIRLIENDLSFDNTISEAYKRVVSEADNCRMLYATHHMKRRDSVLPVIKRKLLSLRTLEQELLEKLLEKAKEGDGK